jgi:phenylpropionate dioxygenase-like ring-hydroxylating dioxygenase large terminal subunit
VVAIQEKLETPKAFNHFDLVTQSWYAIALSKKLRVGQATSLECLGRNLALYRDEAGKAHALDARCPHLGADLGQGKVIGTELQCAFHHWRFNAEGQCVHAPNFATPKRYTRSYPILEQWGFIWLYNGRTPLFDLPQPDNQAAYHVLRLPSQHIKCHPHLVIGNGLDVTHFEALHDFKFTALPKLEQLDVHALRLELHGKPTSKRLQTLTGTTWQDIHASFTTIGGNLAWMEVKTPLHFYVLFTGKPSHNGCDTKTFAFIPKNKLHRLPQMAALVYAILQDDRKILDRLDFQPGFTEADTVLKIFVDTVNRLPVG